MSKIPTYDNPSTLARFIHNNWGDFIHGDYARPPCPELPILHFILESCFVASLETDETRQVQFMICCTPETLDLQQEHSSETLIPWRLDPPRDFKPQELRRLAPAVNPDAAAIWVRFGPRGMDSLKILGLVNLGTSWISARRGFDYRYDPPPSALLVRTEGPGHLSVYQGGFLVATLASGEIRSPFFTLGPKSFPSHPSILLGSLKIFSEGLNLVRQSIQPPEHEPPNASVSFEYTAYLNAIISIINTIELHKHGGAIIIGSPSTLSTLSRKNSQTSLRCKYQFVGKTLLREHFVDLLNARHSLADTHELSDQTEFPTAENRCAVAEATLKYRNALRQLNSTTVFIGGLAATDGALLLTSDLECVGFGTEILLDKIPPPTVYEVLAEPRRKRRPLNSEQFGMRHRSAFRLCAAASDIAVFVISQDGGTSLIWNDGGEVNFLRPLPTTNANMPS